MDLSVMEEFAMNVFTMDDWAMDVLVMDVSVMEVMSTLMSELSSLVPYLITLAIGL